ncbi:PucR family transcriptional regulator [Streptomyces sp. HMX87]|uniref:PucR family transcriptional regulator n=1 Tax=Streptomyces sp. HMX87 TaxID=3390849 RepID=UPI003A8B8873
MSENHRTTGSGGGDGEAAYDTGPGAPGSALTVADVLSLPVVAAGRPRVVTGAAGLDRPVRWVHITELTDPASFLKGGELVLTTGMPLPEEAADVRRYVGELAEVGAAALVLELVRRYHRPPDALVRACRARGLPLIGLTKDVNFLEVTQVVHALVLGSQAEAMRRTQRVHEAFTALTLRGAGAEEVVRAAAEMSGRTVVLENLVHQALICGPSGSTLETAVGGWERRSRAAPSGDRPGVCGPEGWLVAPVEYQGERWGRVVMLPAAPVSDGARAYGAEDAVVLERTAMALTIARLIRPAPWERTAHRGALRDLAEQRHRSAGDARARCAGLGLPTDGCRYLAVLARTGPAGGAAEPEGRLAAELESAGVPALVGELAPGRLAVLLALRPERDRHAVAERLARALRTLDPEAVVSVGAEVADLAHATRSFREAARVAEATPPGQPPPAGRTYHEPSDIGLRRLLYALREDTRVQEYTERQLGRLVDHDARHGTDLVTTLRHYLEAAGNKTTTARLGNLSRETVYQRLRTIERLLDRDLASGTQRTELHVALAALEVLRAR